MEIQLKRYTARGHTFYFTFNFAAGIMFEDITGKVADDVETTKEMAQLIYCGTVEGHREINQPLEMDFEAWTHIVGIDVVAQIFGREIKKKRLFRRAKKARRLI